MKSTFNNVGVVGVGAMGQGIAQMAAQAGAQVFLFDMQAPAVEKAVQAIQLQWQKMLEKGRISSDTCAAYSARLQACVSLDQLSACNLVIEAIVENLAVKKELFAQLEGLVPSTTVLATNTSSLSVTAIAAQLKHPQRFAGYHFFNPVPLM
jgi:3-hydroxybutyryl-CoA dehydrogenase